MTAGGGGEGGEWGGGGRGVIQMSGISAVCSDILHLFGILRTRPVPWECV